MTVHLSTKFNATLCSVMKQKAKTQQVEFRLLMPDILVATVFLEIQNVQL